MSAVRPNISAMKGYAPGEQLNDPDIVKLNTNENPYPPSPRVFEAVQAALTPNKLRKYPEPLGDTFRRAAGKVLGVDPDCILIGNGSDDILTILTRAFVPEGGLIASPTPSYILYKSLAEIQGARFQAVPFADGWSLPVKEWPKVAHLSFVPNPNSPTGTVVPLSAVADLAAQLAPAPLVLDEAYADFAHENGLSRAVTLPNLIVTRTLSKSYSLAGIRFGFAVARPEIVRELVKVKDSYNCDVLSLAAATAALEDQDYFRSVRDKIVATRERMVPALTQLGFEVTPSHANFVWCRRSDRPVKPIYEELKRRKILVRYMNYDGYDGLRISVGSDAEIDTLLSALKAIL
ncbi:histidinol-phosphate aminotransferase : Histidinol-phosphate aminotransferase OS=Singulisphaera acidiphila (strain ATCC BAA-1392 / DSM 18658 / VKM B-2454 / MOB10) GN=hisC PE=3 SV=1: Aminotran_1_2 [Gemmataceae bacterium]|nr:histidinol-phosphate aminotransferase : Histidinol-phosphate aminotransferase OS=Singulisphaera acidiphila (strain ATCC BAA-1392 / DSM 18658 / VKM B-2454 / MOB10) GN=hisC PE=3 SV=1: Aminotran_1_2 [Gemmataceae bacterium]VTT99425.1 histidinol-phosphate aminotransferase : Histidinol-phosphate aminotransferase OS=Singulisphaera acidiphila (strain ATCC BAA-1392 / DSM 18658 / VKM B-2454 / MOB10) GN=hisC PE=3 SV=1: Aminotran_1_2 [Gemmataceae bacterium]